MKKILFTLFSFIAFCGGAWADGPEITIEEVDVILGNTGTLLVNLNPNGEQCRDLQIDITIPEGFEFVSWAKGTGVEHSLGNSNVDTPAGLTGTTKRFVLSDNGGALLPEGNIIKIVIKDDDTDHEVGQTFDGAATTVILSANIVVDGQANGVKDFKFNKIPFTVKVVEAAIQLYEDFVSTEDVESQIEAYEGDVRVHRSLKAGQWNTIILPFAMNEQQIMDCFGEDVQLADLQEVVLSENKKSLAFNFTSVSPLAMVEHHPYIIKTEGIGDIDAETGFKAANVVMSKHMEQVKVGKQYIDVETAPYVVVGAESDGNYFDGTYEMKDITSGDDGCFFAYLAGNKFYYLKENVSTTVKAFRGYFELSELEDFMAGAGANLAFFVDDDLITGVDGITTSAGTVEGVYDLQGRKVSNDLNSLKKGVYIIDGKKVVIK